MNIGVVDVHKKALQKRGYKDFNDWLSDPKHCYIGRNVCFVQGTFKSKYANPYRVKKYGLEKSLEMYYEDWKDQDLTELKNYTELGCWCIDSNVVPTKLEDCRCHGQVLLMILSNQK